MKCRSQLIPFAIFAALLATFLVPCFVAQYQFHLRDPWPMLIGAGSLGVTLFGLYRWVIRQQRKERTIVGTSRHPIFGEIQQLKDHWEGSVSLSAGGPPIEVWGDASKPLPGQVSTFEAIRDRYPELLARTIEAAGPFFASLGISVTTEDLVLDSIYLSEGQLGSFDLTFSTPAHAKKLPWGLSTTFN